MLSLSSLEIKYLKLKTKLYNLGWPKFECTYCEGCDWETCCCWFEDKVGPQQEPTWKHRLYRWLHSKM